MLTLFCQTCEDEISSKRTASSMFITSIDFCSFVLENGEKCGAKLKGWNKILKCLNCKIKFCGTRHNPQFRDLTKLILLKRSKEGGENSKITNITDENENKENTNKRKKSQRIKNQNKKNIVTINKQNIIQQKPDANETEDICMKDITKEIKNKNNMSFNMNTVYPQ